MEIIVIIAAVVVSVLFTQQVIENKRLRNELQNWRAEAAPQRMIFITDNEDSEGISALMNRYIAKRASLPHIYELNRVVKDGVLTIEWNNGDILMALNSSVKELPYLANADMYDTYFLFDQDIAETRVKTMLNSAQLRDYVIKVCFVNSEGV